MTSSPVKTWRGGHSLVFSTRKVVIEMASFKRFLDLFEDDGFANEMILAIGTRK
jgi:hypothetical protein